MKDPIDPENRQQMITYRLEKADQTLKEIDGLLQMGYLSTAANRLYYVCFYAARALLLSSGDNANTHSGVRQKLNLCYVRTGLLSQSLGVTYSRIFRLRQEADYDDFIDATREDILYYLPLAQKFIEAARQLITENPTKD